MCQLGRGGAAARARPDYVHLTALGYDRLAESLHEALLRGFDPTLPAPDRPRRPNPSRR